MKLPTAAPALLLLSVILLSATPQETYRLGPPTPSGDRWIALTKHSQMILLPRHWIVSKARPSDFSLEIQGSGFHPARLLLEVISVPARSSPLAAADKRLQKLKIAPAGVLEELKSELPNGLQVHGVVHQKTIEGVFLTHMMIPYYFKALSNEQTTWRDFKKILGSLTDLSEEMFRETNSAAPQHLISGEWVATADNAWMLQAHHDGWTLEPPQENEILRLSGDFENSLEQISISKEPPGSLNPQEMLERWAQMLGDKNKNPSRLKLTDRSALKYAVSPDQSELTGYLTMETQTYLITVLGSPAIDFHHLRRVLGSMRPMDKEVLAAQRQGTQDLPLPPIISNDQRFPAQRAPVPATGLLAPDPHAKEILRRHALSLIGAGVFSVLLILFFFWMNDEKLHRYGYAFSKEEESSHLRVFAGGRYLTIFPTYLAFMPGGLTLRAVHRKPPLIQAIVALYILRWIAGYLEFETAIAILSGILILVGVLLGIHLGWSIKGTPCWIYDEQGALIFKIRRKLGWFAYRFVILDSQLKPIGYLKMSFLSNFIRKQWWVLDLSAKTIAYVIEDSLILSILRRFIGHLWGLLRADFRIFSNGIIIGQIKRTRSPFNRMILDVHCPADLDPRLLVACAMAINVFDRDRWYPFWSA
ncbi:MAG: hypothetical protein HY547_00025 [Elusimicrobia bacterium]|nr:hypothetical protein [Elusimicrobiota bacterium]